MARSTFWNRNGELHLLEPLPPSFGHWQLGEPLEETHRVLLQKLQSIFGKEVIQTELLSSHRNLVLELGCEDGHKAILRMPVVVPNSDKESTQDLSLFIGEIALLQWLEAHDVALPIPRIQTIVHQSDSEPYSFSVIEKLPGDCVLNAFGGAPFNIKESIVRKMANFMLELNSVVVPQRIGTTVIRSNVIDLIPLIPVFSAFKPSRVFGTLEEYMLFLVQAKRKSDYVGSDDDCRARANEVLNRLLEVLPPVLERLSSTVYRRCVLSHDDLNETNVLVGSDGDVTGIIDWEYHSARPVVLAAEYPRFLRYDGIYDPRFTLQPDQRWWIVSPDDAMKLRGIYAETIKAQNEDYWRALVDGELLRQVYEWLTEGRVDPGCVAMGRWMDEAFGPHSSVEVNA